MTTLDSPLVGGSARNILSDLPLELIDLVLAELDVQDLFVCSAVSRRWRQLTVANDRLYAARLCKKYNLVTLGKDPLPVHPGVDDLLERYSRLSASPFFSGASTLRELALRDLYLLKSWRRGSPKQTNLNAEPSGCPANPPEHVDAVLSVVVDSVYSMVITGDRAGKVVFWDFRTKQAIGRLCLQPNDAVAAMAIEGDYLVMGTWVNTVYIARRDFERKSPSINRVFSLVGEFFVPSAVISICLQDKMCIVGCNMGEICFYDINVRPGETSVQPREVMKIRIPDGSTQGRTKNISLSYRKPLLFTSSTFVSQLLPLDVDEDNGRHLWEYDEDQIILRTFDVSSDVVDDNKLCVFHPLNDQGDLLVAWTDRSVYSVGDIEPTLLNYPNSVELIDREHGEPVRSIASGDGYFVTASLDNTVALFATDGRNTCIAQYDLGENVHCVAVDPCFFVAVSDSSVILYDFTPPSFPYNNSHSPYSHRDREDNATYISPYLPWNDPFNSQKDYEREDCIASTSSSISCSSSTDGSSTCSSTPPTSPEEQSPTEHRKSPRLCRKLSIGSLSVNGEMSPEIPLSDGSSAKRRKLSIKPISTKRGSNFQVNSPDSS